MNRGVPSCFCLVLATAAAAAAVAASSDLPYGLAHPRRFEASSKQRNSFALPPKGFERREDEFEAGFGPQWGSSDDDLFEEPLGFWDDYGRREEVQQQQQLQQQLQRQPPPPPPPQQQQPRSRVESYQPQQREQQQRRRLRVQPQYKRVDKSNQEQPVLSDPSVYRPASGPAYADATNVGELGASTAMAEPRFDPIPYPEHSGEVPEDQRRIEEAVLAGANAYKPDGGVYQTEDRLEFQIHGHEGPHSYRYGYDTGHGYNRQFRYEERDGDGFVKGRYGFFDRYGKLQIVNYSADPYKGFHAEGAHVPRYPH